MIFYGLCLGPATSWPSHDWRHRPTMKMNPTQSQHFRPPSLWNGWRRGKLSNCRHVGVNAVHLVQKFLLNYITLTSSHEACCSLLLFLLYFTPPLALSISLSLLSYKCLNEPKTMTTISSLRRRVNEKSTADVFTKSLVDATWVSRDSSVCSTTISRRKKAGSKLYQCQRAWVQLEC